MRKILRLPRSRSAADFESLLRPHVEYLYRLAYRFTGRVEDAEDLVQDLLVKLYPRLHEIETLGQPRPWLARVLYRQFIDMVRRRERSAIDRTGTVSSEDEDDPLAALPADEPAPEEACERSLLQAQVLRALDQLNGEQRAVLTLHDIEGYRLEELEGILETPLGTLKSRLHRARRRLRALLAMEPFAADERVSE